MKKISLLILIVFFIFSGIKLNGQICDVSIGNIKGAKPGDSLLFPVYVKNFNKVVSIGFSILIDTNVLTNMPGDTNCLRNIHASIADNLLSNYSIENQQIYIAWYHSNFMGITLADSTKLFDLRLLYKGGVSILCVDNNSNNYTISDASGTEFIVNWHCGSINTDSAYCKADFLLINCNSPYSFNFQDNSLAENITSRLWDFGDGVMSTERYTGHTYSAPGNYNVCLKIESSDSGKVICTDTYCKNIYIAQCCHARFEYYNDNLDNYYFYDYSIWQNLIKRKWDFGDGTISEERNPRHKFEKQDRTYKVSLIIISIVNGNFICTDTVTKFIYVPFNCWTNYNVVYNDSLDNFNFINTSSSHINNWVWDFGDSTSSIEQNPVHKFNYTAYFKVCLNASYIDSGKIECSKINCQTIYYQTPNYCKSNFYTYFTDSIQGYTFIDYSIGKNITNWNWDFGDSTTSKDKTPVHKYKYTGYYNVCLKITAKDNGIIKCSDSICKNDYFLSQNYCQANFYTYFVDSIQGNIFMNDSKGKITNWNWDFGDGFTSTEKYPYHFYSKTGEYNVCLTVTKSDSGKILCNNTYCYKAIVDNTPYNTGYCPGCPPPDPGGNSGNDSIYICKAGYYSIEDTIRGILYFKGLAKADSLISWDWDFGDSTKSLERNPIHTFKEAGKYNVCLTINSLDSVNNICSNTYCGIYNKTLIITSNSEISEEDNFIQIYPNPANEAAIVSWQSVKRSVVKLSVYDVMGREIMKVADKEEQTGKHIAELNLSNFEKGIYFVKISINDIMLTKKLIKF